MLVYSPFVPDATYTLHIVSAGKKDHKMLSVSLKYF